VAVPYDAAGRDAAIAKFREEIAKYITV